MVSKSIGGRFVVAACAVGALFCVEAVAHGPQIQIGVQNGKIVTRALHNNEPYNAAMTPIQRVYEIPMVQRTLGDANDGWYATPVPAFPYSGPGIATKLGGFQANSVLSLTFVDELLIWNGTKFIDPGSEQIDAYRGATHTAWAITTENPPYQSFSYPAITNTGDEHQTTYFRLLGNGQSPNTLSDNGVYLLSLRLKSDHPAVDDSEPFYFLLNKNASASAMAAAKAYLGTNHLAAKVPTVSQWGLVILALILTVAGKLAFGGRLRKT